MHLQFSIFTLVVLIQFLMIWWLTEFLMAFRSIGRLPSWFSPLHVAQFSEFVQRIRELCAGNE
jgi:hypothetical protein